MSFIEAPMFVLNSYIGYTILGVADIGKIKISDKTAVNYV